MAEVKKETGWNGTLNFIGPDTEQEVPIVMESMLEPIGITLNVTDNLSITSFEIDVVVKKDFDLSVWGIAADDPDPFFSLWDNLVSTSNYDGYSSPAMTAAVNALGAAGTPAAKKAAIAKIVSAWGSTYPVLNTGASSYLTIHKPDVHGIYLTTGGMALFDKAWVS